MLRKRKRAVDPTSLAMPPQKRQRLATSVPQLATSELRQLFLNKMTTISDPPSWPWLRVDRCLITPELLHIRFPKKKINSHQIRGEMWNAISDYLYPLICEESHYFLSLQSVDIHIPFDRSQQKGVDNINELFSLLARLPRLRKLIFSTQAITKMVVER